MSQTYSPLQFDAARWQPILADIARRHHVPGIVAGVLYYDKTTGLSQRFAANTGVTSLATRIENTPDTLCQIGSITKVVTGTMIMQLREEGKLDLDTPVTEILPGLKLADVDPSTITIHQLLTHTSGIDGDVFTDTGRGDNAVEIYVDQLADVHSLFAPGEGWSYSNSGWVLLGRVIEVLDGCTWDESLQNRISKRLGLQKFLTMPEQVMMHRNQQGHVRAPKDTEWRLAPVTSLPRSVGPAGIISSSVDDLLSFAGSFLAGGKGSDGQPLLSEESVRLMTDTHVKLAPGAAVMVPRWGIGWMLNDWEGHPVFAHGGTTIGNKAWLEVLPEDGIALVVFCNGGVAELAGPEVLAAFSKEFMGITAKAPDSPIVAKTEAKIDPSLLGTYADFSSSLEVHLSEDGQLQAKVERKGVASGDESAIVEFFPSETANQYLGRLDTLAGWNHFTFDEVDGQQCLYADIRCLRKVEAEKA